MQDRLTPTAAEALRLAEREADLARRPAVDSDHLLLALIAVRGVASVVLKQSGADADALRAASAKVAGAAPITLAHQLKKALRRGLGDPEARRSENLERVLTMADEAARELGHPKIGTEHLLWALVEHADGVAREYVASIELTPEQARRRILEMLRVAQDALADQSDGRAARVTKRPRTPALDAFCTNLVKRARKHRLPKLVRCVAEGRHVKEILLRLVARNPLIVGEPGSGKTSLAQALAKEIALSAAPEQLLDKRLLQLDPVLLVAGTKYRGQFEERVATLLSEIRASGDVILFIDDLHLLALPASNEIADGTSASVADLMRLLTPALDRLEIQILATCASQAEKRVIAQFPCLATDFQRVALEAPDRDLVTVILGKKRLAYEAHHGITIEPTALGAAVAAAANAGDGDSRTLVVRALDALDRAAARLVLERSTRGRTTRVLDEDAMYELLGAPDPTTTARRHTHA